MEYSDGVAMKYDGVRWGVMEKFENKAEFFCNITKKFKGVTKKVMEYGKLTIEYVGIGWRKSI